jgi:hypothetical protein
LRPEPVGSELAPAKVLLFVDPAQMGLIEGRREIPLRLGPELLAARWIALTRFPGT